MENNIIRVEGLQGVDHVCAFGTEYLYTRGDIRVSFLARMAVAL